MNNLYLIISLIGNILLLGAAITKGYLPIINFIYRKNLLKKQKIASAIDDYFEEIKKNNRTNPKSNWKEIQVLLFKIPKCNSNDQKKVLINKILFKEREYAVSLKQGRNNLIGVVNLLWKIPSVKVNSLIFKTLELIKTHVDNQSLYIEKIEEYLKKEDYDTIRNFIKAHNDNLAEDDNIADKLDVIFEEIVKELAKIYNETY